MIVKLIYELNNHHSINKKHINADYSAVTKKNETNHKVKVKVNDRIRIIKYKNIFSKSCTKNLLRGIFVTDSVLKTNPCTYKTK